jgi:hypothetical protein
MLIKIDHFHLKNNILVEVEDHREPDGEDIVISVCKDGYSSFGRFPKTFHRILLEDVFGRKKYATILSTRVLQREINECFSKEDYKKVRWCCEVIEGLLEQLDEDRKEN